MERLLGLLGGIDVSALLRGGDIATTAATEHSHRKCGLVWLQSGQFTSPRNTVLKSVEEYIPIGRALRD